MSSANFNGSSGGNYSINLQVDLVGQDYAANKSTVKVNAWVHKNAGSGFFNSSSGGDININGNVMGRSFGGYDFRSQQDLHFVTDEYYDIYHDGSGNANPYFQADYDLQNGPYVTNASVGANMSLPTIPRSTSITGWSVVSVTDVSITLSLSAADACDYYSWWINDGPHNDTPMSGTSVTFTIGGTYPSATQFKINGAVRRQSSGIWTTTGDLFATTANQNNFLGLLDDRLGNG